MWFLDLNKKLALRRLSGNTNRQVLQRVCVRVQHGVSGEIMLFVLSHKPFDRPIRIILFDQPIHIGQVFCKR